MKPIDWFGILREAMKQRKTAGFQNMHDVKKAKAYARRNGFAPVGEQQLRSLLTEHGD